jgi:cation diffusion facilitator family transporter
MSPNLNIRIQFITVTVGAILLFGKFAAYWITHSSTVLTDALESIINVVAGALGLFSLILSAKPKDENHPYGHGRVEFISAGVEGTLITLAGIIIVGQAVWVLIMGTVKIENIDFGIYIAVVAGSVNYFLGWLTEKQGHKSGSLAMIAGGKHLKSDAYSTAGMIIGLILIYILKNIYHLDSVAQIVDNCVALVFGIIIAWTGYTILRESVAGIMDEVDIDLVNNIVSNLNKNRMDNWIDVHNLRIIKYGASLHFDCHLTVPWYFTTLEAHKEVDALEEMLKKQCLDTSVEVFVHVDPCLPSSCSLCQLIECSQRKAVFNNKIEWTPELVMRNKKHGL